MQKRLNTGEYQNFFVALNIFQNQIARQWDLLMITHRILSSCH